MKEILFRGKSIIDKETWVYGVPVRIVDSTHMKNNQLEMVERHVYYDGEFSSVASIGERVVSETIGQYIRETDKYGIRIFDGDIVRKMYTSNGETYLFMADIHNYFDRGADIEYEVIGNIHDNPELVKQLYNEAGYILYADNLKVTI